MIKSLLYVSLRRLNAGCEIQEIESIVSCSRSRNAALELTGALVATPYHFAQILEGKASCVDEVMASIARDERHSDILVAPIEQRRQREFHRWVLAYHGESSYVSELVGSALEAPAFDVARHAQNIRSLMAMFV